MLAAHNQELSRTIDIKDKKQNYYKCRQKKILHLMNLMQRKGFPVLQIYDKELKHIKTVRI